MATQTSFTVTKSTVELYKIRHASGCYWADITIDANGHQGRISIASDFGNWSNYWGACGSDFKSFLAQINHDYAASKFGAEQWIDVSKSLDEFKKMVDRHEHLTIITKENARAIRAEIKDLRGESAQLISQAVEQTSYLYKFLWDNADAIDFAYKLNPHFLALWNQVWPVLLAEFAKDPAPAAASAIEEGAGS